MNLFDFDTTTIKIGPPSIPKQMSVTNVYAIKIQSSPDGNLYYWAYLYGPEDVSIVGEPPFQRIQARGVIEEGRIFCTGWSQAKRDEYFRSTEALPGSC